MDEKLEYLSELIELIQDHFNTFFVKEAAIYSNTGWDIREGAFDDFQLYYFTEGTANLMIGDRYYTARPGDIFFVDNSIRNFGSSGNFTMFYYSFKVEQHRTENSALYQSIRRCFGHLSENPLNIKGNNLYEIFIELVNLDMNGLILKRQITDRMEMKLLAFQILVKIFKAVNNDAYENSSYRYKKHSAMISDIISFMSENLHKDLKLSELSRKYNLTARYLNRVFKGITGCPILQYRQRLKIEKAKRLLSSTAMSVTDIAMELNFSTSQHFSNKFRKLTGVTPKEYRKVARSEIFMKR